LVVLWEAGDRICGKRLKPLIPLLIPAMERHGRLALDEAVRSRLFRISAASIDRVLAPVRTVALGGRRRSNGHASTVRRSVPVRTYADWNDPAPGFMEADLVAHGGPSASGSFVQTLTLTDVATGWTECAPLLFREQRLLGEVMTALRAVLPFPLLGFDTDNDSVFMNETIKPCAKRRKSTSPAHDRIARTTRPMSSRRTAPSCDGLWAIADTRALPRPPNWRGSIAACGSL
jgi:hypothetical protein